ncbi:MAG: hypothetical protein EXQ87_09865 [Alphaproteobacteria bacterium]|nr:hypothetical protein [Alphaproteobacteria bacterium]
MATASAAWPRGGGVAEAGAAGTGAAGTGAAGTGAGWAAAGLGGAGLGGSGCSTAAIVTSTAGVFDPGSSSSNHAATPAMPVNSTAHAVSKGPLALCRSPVGRLTMSTPRGTSRGRGTADQLLVVARALNRETPRNRSSARSN